MRELLAIDGATFEAWTEQAKVFLASGGVVDRSLEAAARLIPARRAVGSVAVIPIRGFLTQKPSLFSMLFGGTSYEGVAADVEAAAADASVGAIVLDVDSPGGSVQGNAEAAERIRAVRGSKPIFAVANPFATSAAYFLASQADEVIGLPTSLTGSIGVIMEHVDMSEALAKEGVKVTVLTYGKNKAMGHPAQPLGDEALATIQARLDYFGRMFEAGVAKGRGISVEAVRKDFGEGAYFTADEALRRGIIDRIDTLDEVIRQAANGRRPASMGPRAEEPVPEVVAATNATVAEFDPALLRLRAKLAGVVLELPLTAMRY
jgi:signal peptide peptidase SppA